MFRLSRVDLIDNAQEFDGFQLDAEFFTNLAYDRRLFRDRRQKSSVAGSNQSTFPPGSPQ